MLEGFSRQLETLGIPFDPETHRLRCTGHIRNLVFKAFLFENYAEAVHHNISLAPHKSWKGGEDVGFTGTPLT
jgi:hypothetical protein